MRTQVPQTKHELLRTVEGMLCYMLAFVEHVSLAASASLLAVACGCLHTTKQIRQTMLHLDLHRHEDCCYLP